VTTSSSSDELEPQAPNKKVISKILISWVINTVGFFIKDSSLKSK
jgi:hypothetical protein